MEDQREFIENKYVKVGMVDGIIIGYYKPLIDLEGAKAVVSIREEISMGIDRPALADIRNLKSVTDDAREWLATKEANRFLKAMAIITNNPIQNLFANFYLKLSKPPMPTQLFTSEEKAIRWLKLYLQQKQN